MKNLKILCPEILSEYSKKKTIPTVAVVGNAGVSEADQNQIRKADCVVRFNNFATRDGIKKTKDPFICDILFSSFDLHSQGSSPKHVVIGIPAPFKIKEIIYKPAKWYPNSDLWMVNPYTNMMLCEKLELNSLGCAQPLPSLGTTALFHLKDYPCKFYVCGYNWYFDEATQLFQKYHMKEKDPQHFNHFYHREIKWIIKNILPKSNFVFSDSCLRLLKIAQSQITNG